MKRIEIFKELEAAGAVVFGAEWHLDDTMDRAFDQWRRMGSPKWAKIEITGGQLAPTITIGPLYGYV